MSDFKPNGSPEPRHTRLPEPPVSDRERLRDIIIVFVTYPITPTKRTEKVARSKPWLEAISLALKILLALYALYEAYTSGGGESG